MSVGLETAKASYIPRARSLSPSALFWSAMLFASALGTNIGDFWTDWLGLGLASSAGLAGAVSLALILGDRLAPDLELFFWLAIVVLRAMATNIGDFLADDLGVTRMTSTLALAAVTLLAGYFTSAGRSPLIGTQYWLAMALGGVFGTVDGDLVSHAIGLPMAAAVLVPLVAAAVALRANFAPAAVLGYWAIVLAERAAGTAVGDLFAEERGLAFGLPVSMAITGVALALALAARFFTSPQH